MLRRKVPTNTGRPGFHRGTGVGERVDLAQLPEVLREISCHDRGREVEGDLLLQIMRAHPNETRCFR
eukprot:8311571-Pyramimonas_sp.AAC.1